MTNDIVWLFTPQKKTDIVGKNPPLRYKLHPTMLLIRKYFTIPIKLEYFFADGDAVNQELGSDSE